MNNKTTSDQTRDQITDDQPIMSKVIEECQNKGYLVSFLENHRNELENIMIEEMEYAESFDEYMERANTKAIKKAEPEIVEKHKPEIIEKAKPEIEQDFFERLYSYVMLCRQGKMTIGTAAKKLNMPVSKFKVFVS